MSTKHTVTLPDGTTATRTSANRVYPFAVAIAPETKGERLDELAGSIAYSKSLIADYSATLNYLVDGGETTYEEPTYKGGLGRTWLVNVKPGKSRSGLETQRGQRNVLGTTDEAIASYRKYIADLETRIAEAEANIITVTAGPELVGKWRLSGWQSRADLAQSEQRTQSGRYPRRAAAVILESVYATK